MKKIFTKKEIHKVKSLPIEPSRMGEPKNVDEFQLRGMAYYARELYIAAEDDLKKAVVLDESNVDAYYGLGMVLKALNRNNEAVEAFTQVLNLIKVKSDLNKTKNDMLRRLALGHINQISKGDWNLEKEIWQRIE